MSIGSAERFEVHEQIGTGGMAVVHRATEHLPNGSQRVVALKRMHSTCAKDSSLVESFLREAVITKELNHPNVARTFEYGPMGASHFISMEYVQGQTLLAALRASSHGAPLPIHVTVSLLQDVCSGLEYVHNRRSDGRNLQLLHRDISPSNLIIDTDGRVRIIDFGIAKTSLGKQTEGILVKGKLCYMSPEALLRNMALDPRTDLFSVGVVAHELLTARPLFASETAALTVRAVLERSIPHPAQFNSACPLELQTLVMSALERTRNDRCASATIMLDTLGLIAAGLDTPPTHQRVIDWCQSMLLSSAKTIPCENFVEPPTDNLLPTPNTPFSVDKTEVDRFLPLEKTPSSYDSITPANSSLGVDVTFRQTCPMPILKTDPDQRGLDELLTSRPSTLRFLRIACLVMGLLLVAVLLAGLT